MTPEEKYQKYLELLHAVQTGIAWNIAISHPDVSDINQDSNLREHKHLRVGIDVTKSDQGALVSLLIKKGIFTEDEYLDEIVEFMQREVKAYEEGLSAHFGRPITLH